MRIAFLTGSFPKLSETFIINQVTGLLDRGHKVTVFTEEIPAESREHDVVAEYDLLEQTVVSPTPETQSRVPSQLLN